MSKNVAIAYCAENQNTAQDIDRQLSLASYQFQHFSCSKATDQPPLPENLTDFDGPILLVISDNFLKSAQCMSRALKMMQKKGGQTLTVVVDGVETADDGSTTYTPTNFDRVSDIIQYINYWQDQYLDLRRQKRDIAPGNEDAFNNHLKVMREISSEVGEFLRLLRNNTYVSWNDFAQNDFEQFFAFLQDREGWENYQALAPSLAQSEAPTEEAQEQTQEPPVDPATIPGMELLEETEEEQEVVSEAIAEEEIMDAPTETQAEETEEPEAEARQAEDEETTEEQEQEYSEEEDFAEEDEEDDDDESEEEDDDEDEEEDDYSEGMDVKHIIEQSEQLFASQQTDEGFALLESTLQTAPDNVDLRYHYALSLAQLKDDFEAASEQLENILEFEPDHVDAHFLLGKLYQLGENYEAAVQHYEKTTELASDNESAHFQLGMLLAEQNLQHPKKAAKHLKKAFKLNPSNEEAAYRYGLILHEKLDKPKKAVKYLTKTIDIAPKHPFAHYDLALVYHQLGEQNKAYEAYLKAIAINPELQTQENDAAFTPEPQPKAPEATPATILEAPAFPDQQETVSSSTETDTIEALKQNIMQLEEMIKAKHREEEEQAQRAAAAPPVPRRDKIIFITGATAGIGRATAEKFASEGYKLILNGRRVERLQALKTALEEKYGSEILLLPFDVRDVNAVQAAVNSLEGPWKNVDILLNNAGKAKGLAPIHEGELRHWEEMIDTNLKGLLYLTRAITPSMVARKSGHIINICSTAGKEVYPKGNVYCATKFAVDALTQAMRIDLHTHDIKVSQVSPGHVEETEFAAVRFDGDTVRAKIYEDFLPLTSKDVAEAIYFIAGQPKHVNIQDVLMMGTQQASSNFINRSGREALEED